MAHLFQRSYGSWQQTVSAKDMVKYTVVAVLLLLGVAGLLQSLAGTNTPTTENHKAGYSQGVYIDR